MPIVFKSKLSSAKANETFMDRTVDTDTIGKVGLNNADTASGAAIANTQREINLSRKIIHPQASVINGDVLVPDTLSLNQEFRVLGNATPVTLNSLPFGPAKSVEDGAEISVVGHDDTFTVELTFNDVDYGLLLNGDATLKKGFELRLTSTLR